MPVKTTNAKKGLKVNKSTKVAPPDEDEEEEQEVENDEEEEDETEEEEDGEEDDTDADDDADDTDDADTPASASSTSAKPRKPKTATVPWTVDLDIVLGKTMRRIKDGKLPGSLTAHAIMRHLAKHEAFAGIELTPTAIASRVRNRIAAGAQFPPLETRKYDIKDLNKALSMDDEDDE